MTNPISLVKREPNQAVLEALDELKAMAEAGTLHAIAFFGESIGGIIEGRTNFTDVSKLLWGLEQLKFKICHECFESAESPDGDG